jgi:type IV pilus assembly protein PilM
MKAISLDVGASRIMIAEANVTAQAVNIDKIIPVDVPMGSIADGVVADQSSVRSALEVTMKANKVKAKSTIVTVNSNSLVVRKLEVPLASEKDTRNLARVEMQQYLPSGRKFMVDFVAIGDTVSANGGKMSVVKAAALPEELCEGYYQLLQSLRLKANRMDILPSVLGRIFSTDSRINNNLVGVQPLIVVELSQFQTAVSVLIEGDVDLSRTLPVGFANLERTVADRLQITPEEARAQIRTAMDFQNDTTEQADSARRFLSQIVQEIRKVQQYLRAKNLHDGARVYLYGIGSGCKGMDAFLTDQLDMVTETIRSHNRINLPPQDKGAQLAHCLNAAGALLMA